MITSHEPTLAPSHAVAVERRRVLVVDDVAANRLMLQMFLEQQGFAADPAAGGEEAVQRVANTTYDAILMDIEMPGLDGIAATRLIRTVETNGSRPVIVAVTASSDRIVRERCFAAGMDGHFTKPLDLLSFCRALTDLIAVRQIKAADALDLARSETTPRSLWPRLQSVR